MREYLIRRRLDRLTRKALRAVFGGRRAVFGGRRAAFGGRPIDGGSAVGVVPALTFVDDVEMTRLNKEFRGIDGTTDVLAFDAGDIVISLDRAKAQAFEYGHSLERELCFLVVHGALHLLGYGHDCPESESVMTAKQKEILKGLGLER